MPLMFLTAMAGKMWDRAYDFIPFFLLARNEGRVEFKLNLNKIIEGVVIALVTGMIVGWSVRAEMAAVRAEIAAVRAESTEVKAQVSKIYSDIYKPSVGAGQ